MRCTTLSFLERPIDLTPVLRMDDRGRRLAAREMAQQWDHEALIARQTEFWLAMWERAGKPASWERDIVRGGGF